MIGMDSGNIWPLMALKPCNFYRLFQFMERELLFGELGVAVHMHICTQMGDVLEGPDIRHSGPDDHAETYFGHICMVYVYACVHKQ